MWKHDTAKLKKVPCPISGIRKLSFSLLGIFFTVTQRNKFPSSDLMLGCHFYLCPKRSSQESKAFKCYMFACTSYSWYSKYGIELSFFKFFNFFLLPMTWSSINCCTILCHLPSSYLHPIWGSFRIVKNGT